MKMIENNGWNIGYVSIDDAIGKSSKLSFMIEIEITPKTFWALLPAINLNMYSKEIEIEWLCIGIYISKRKRYEN